MAHLRPYLRFNGNAREAFEFYKDCLGGELTLQTVEQSPMAQFLPDNQADIFHAQLQKGDLVLLGSDMGGEGGLKVGNNMVLTLESENKAEAKELFTKLAEGGSVGHELSDQPWGAIGDFKDKYGVEWFVVSM